MIQTFQYTDFYPIHSIVDLKVATHSTISVVIPARNEEQTIGSIVTDLRVLAKDTALIDEIIVMDCASEDATVAIAKDAGARVVPIFSIAPDDGLIGKGVALWKSQFVSSGDIVIYVDADVIDFDERFIVGLAGALITHDDIEIVKAAYRRPLVSGAERIEDCGGRVTELLVRPLINMFLPELSEIRQPLAGEYALRKKTIQDISFYSEYGVDMGLLLEIYVRYGQNAIGQVEMGTRTHRNRDLLDLSKMAFDIEHVFFDFLDTYNSIPYRGKRHEVLKTWENGNWTEYHLHNRILPPKSSIQKL